MCSEVESWAAWGRLGQGQRKVERETAGQGQDLGGDTIKCAEDSYVNQGPRGEDWDRDEKGLPGAG